MKNSYKLYVAKLQRRLRHSWDGNIKTGLRENFLEMLYWIEVAPGRAQ
jgi:hypothetical protein